jgi:hypothetical protein
MLVEDTEYAVTAVHGNPIITAITYRRMRWAGHVVRKGDEIFTCRENTAWGGFIDRTVIIL